MHKPKRVLQIIAVIILVLLMATAIQAQDSGTLDGVFSVIFGDGQNGEYLIEYRLDQADGTSYRLDVDEATLALAGGFASINGQQVSVTYDSINTRSATPTYKVFSITPGLSRVDGSDSRLAGTQKWANLLCKYAGDTSNEEGTSTSYVLGLYGNSFPQLNHYWQEMSNDNITTTATAHDWKTLPKTRQQYLDMGSAGAYLDALFNDCVGLHDADVDFSNNYKGIGIILNDLIDCCAWGGSRFVTLDGVQKSWSTIWMPPWAAQTQSVWAHEQGHAYGLPHSNNADNDGNPYDNPWDVMSDSYETCSSGNYSYTAQYTNMWHAKYLNWIPSGNIVELTSGTTTVNLDSWYYSGSSNDYMIFIPTNQAKTTGYTIEARKPINGNCTAYDDALPDSGIIINTIDMGRGEWVWLKNPGSATSDADDRKAWKPGQTFNGGNFTVEVLSTTTNGYSVRVDFGGTGGGDFELIAPADGTDLGIDPDTVFEWGPLDGAAEYKLIVKSQDRKYKFKVRDAAAAFCSTTCSFDTSTDSTWKPRFKRDHKWKVKAFDGSGNVLGKAGVWWITTNELLPNPIVQVSPSYGGGGTEPVALLWQDDFRVDDYRVKLRYTDGTLVADTGWMPWYDEFWACDGNCGVTLWGNGAFTWQVFGRRADVARKGKSPRRLVYVSYATLAPDFKASADKFDKTGTVTINGMGVPGTR